MQLKYEEVLEMIDDPELKEKWAAKHAEGYLTGNVYNGPGGKDDVNKRVKLYLED